MEDSFAKLSAAAFIGAEYERSLSDIKIQCDALRAENAALRAAVAEMQRMLPVIDKLELRDSYWEWATEHTGIATANAYRAYLQAALDKINETGQDT